jgi:hypothetical protein
MLTKRQLVGELCQGQVPSERQQATCQLARVSAQPNSLIIVGGARNVRRVSSVVFPLTSGLPFIGSTRWEPPHAAPDSGGLMDFIVKSLLISALILGVAVASCGAAQGGQGQTPSKRAPTDTVKMLWSADEAVRSAAKEQIVEMGSSASPALISVLEMLHDIRCDPRAAKGKAYSQMYSGVATAKYARSRQVRNRVAYDVGGLLAKMHVVGGAPAIMRLAELEGLFSGGGLTGLGEILVSFGPDAIPLIVEEIETMPSRVPPHGVIHPLLPGNEQQMFLSQMDDPLIIVLGRIGDPRGLPILEKLQDEITEGRLPKWCARDVRRSLWQIKRKSGPE